MKNKHSIRGRLFRLWNSIANNPIIFHEWIKQLRGSRYFLMLGILLAAGTASIVLFWDTPNFSDYPAGRKMFHALVSGEFLVILLVLPGLVAHSLIIERDRQTLPLLLTTPIGPGKILMGKLCSTLGVMLILIIATYPLISMCFARGGVSPWEVVLWFLGLLYLCFVVACFACYHALNAANLFRAIATTLLSLFLIYLTLNLAMLFFSGIIFAIATAVLKIIGEVTSQPSLFEKIHYFGTILLGLLNLLVFILIPLFLLSRSKAKLEMAESQARSEWLEWELNTFQFGQDINPPDINKKETKPSRWEFGEKYNPFYLRERLGHLASQPQFAVPSWYFVILLAHFLFVFTPFQEGRWVAVITFLFVAQASPIYAANLFAGERENNTWDLLVTTVCKTKDLLDGKMMGALYHSAMRTAILFFPPVLLAAFLTAMFNAEGLEITGPTIDTILYFSAVLAIQLLFITTLSTFFSILFDHVNKVLVYSWTTVFVYSSLSFFFYPVVQRDPAFVLNQILIAINPINVIINIDGSIFLHMIIYAAATLAIYAMNYRILNQIR